MGQYGVVGDPEGMRSLADDLVKRADRLGELRRQMRSQWKDVKMGGPIALLHDTLLESQWRRLKSSEEALDAMAKRLRSSATQVQEQIAIARQRAIDEEIRRMKERALQEERARQAEQARQREAGR